MSCSENGNFAVIATMSESYPKISLLPVLSQISNITSLFIVKISEFQTHLQWADFFLHRAEADSLSS